MPLASPASDHLVRLERIDSGESIALCSRDGRRLLGRASDASIRIVHPHVSRRQAVLGADEEGLLIERVDGAAEMRLNDRVLTEPTYAHDGDVLSIGECRIRVSISAGAPAADTASQSERFTGESVTILGTSSSPAGNLPWSSIALTGNVRLGRDPSVVEVELPHPMVSRTHAILRRTAEGYSIEDLGSANGTFVNGARVADARLLLAGDELSIGPYSLAFTGAELRTSTRRRQGSVDVSGLWKAVAVKGTTRWLLQDVTLSVSAGEFVAVIGPSGCGKSTLLRALAGRSAFTSGSVHLCGYSIATELDAVKRSVAVVPQRETLFDALTVREMLSFTGDLRLPSDTSNIERERIVDTVLDQVGLSPLSGQRIETLSGGQRRRLVLANEILSGPSVVFLDEVTSGLDEGSDLEIMRLLRQLADSGRAVVCVTHTVANLVDLCDRVVVMARGGIVVCDERPEDTLKRFGISRFAELYPRLAEGAEVRAPAPSAMSRHAPSSGESKGDAWRQLRILALREIRLLFAKPALLLLAAGQSVIIGLALRLAFGGPPFSPQQSLSLLFFLGICCFWFGCNNASKEIVKQRDILIAEFAVNLQLRPFVGAKVLVQATVAMLQTAILLTTLRLVDVEWPPSGTTIGLLASAAAGACMGLAISGSSDSTDQAATLVPISLIPQLLLSGIVTSYPSQYVESFSSVFISGHWMGNVAVAGSSHQTERAIRDALVLLVHSGAFIACLFFVLRRRLASSLSR